MEIKQFIYNDLEPVKDLIKGNFDNLERLSIEAGFTEKLDIKQINGYSKYIEELVLKRNSIKQHAPAEIYKEIDFQDYYEGYRNGFIRTRKNHDEPFNIVAAGAFKEEFKIHSEFRRDFGDIIFEKYIKEVENPNPFIFIQKTNYNQDMFNTLLTTGKKIRHADMFPSKRTRKDWLYFSLMGGAISIGSLVAMGGSYSIDNKWIAVPLGLSSLLLMLTGAISSGIYLNAMEKNKISEIENSRNGDLKYGIPAIETLIEMANK